MSKRNDNPMDTQKPKKRGGGLLGRILRRFFLLLFTTIFLILAALILVMNLVFNGPSPAARSVLTMSLIEASATKWVPALFIGQETVDAIRAGTNAAFTEEQTDTSQIVIQKYDAIASSDEWANHPDGVRIEEVYGDTYTAHVMIVRDPAMVYMGTSTEKFSTSIPGKRINEMMEANPDAIAAVNAGAFFDNGTSDSSVGSYPEGLVVAGGQCVWSTGSPPGGLTGFAGFNQDNILVVTQKNLTKNQAAELGIRDGCCFGPALIINGEINLAAYNDDSGFNPRTAIGQRSDGAVIFVCIDGRQPTSMGGTYADVINIMQEYGAVNACNMDGGSSSVMMYRDVNNILTVVDEKNFGNNVKMVNNYSLLQSQPRKMPNFWMVRPVK